MKNQNTASEIENDVHALVNLQQLHINTIRFPIPSIFPK